MHWVVGLELNHHMANGNCRESSTDIEWLIHLIQEAGAILHEFLDFWPLASLIVGKMLKKIHFNGAHF